MATDVSSRDAFRAALADGLPHEFSTAGAAPALPFFVVPPAHVRALDPAVALVRGGRGAGKSSWAEALQSDQHRARLGAEPRAERWLRDLAENRIVVARGFDEQALIDEHPTRPVMTTILDRGIAAGAIWRAVVLRHAAPETDGFGELREWTERAAWVSEFPERTDRALILADERLRVRGQTLLLVFDALDRSANDWPTRRVVLRALLETLQDLSAFQALRGKAFVRPDMLQHPDVTAFPDASKVLQRAVSLDWGARDLYHLFFQHLGNAGEPAGSEFRSVSGSGWVDFKGTWQAQQDLARDEFHQAELFHQIAGPFMGRNRRRGYPYSWLPKHLADGQGRVSPRSFLKALRSATDESLDRYPDHEYALHYEAIKIGVREASDIRVREIAEDVPWIEVVTQPLRGLMVPCTIEELDTRWRGEATLEHIPRTGPDVPQRIEEGLPGLRQELRDLGVLEPMADGRMNMPDIFRVALGLARKGGVRPAQ